MNYIENMDLKADGALWRPESLKDQVCADLLNRDNYLLIPCLHGVEEIGERAPVKIWRYNGKVVIRSYNCSKNEHTDVDLVSLIKWLKTDDGARLLLDIGEPSYAMPSTMVT